VKGIPEKCNYQPVVTTLNNIQVEQAQSLRFVLPYLKCFEESFANDVIEIAIGSALAELTLRALTASKGIIGLGECPSLEV
jgi:hypothetical protein